MTKTEAVAALGGADAVIGDINPSQNGLPSVRFPTSSGFDNKEVGNDQQKQLTPDEDASCRISLTVGTVQDIMSTLSLSSSSSSSSSGPWTVRLFDIQRGSIEEVADFPPPGLDVFDVPTRDEPVLFATMWDGGTATCRSIVLKPDPVLLEAKASGCILSVADFVTSNGVHVQGCSLRDGGSMKRDCQETYDNADNDLETSGSSSRVVVYITAHRVLSTTYADDCIPCPETQQQHQPRNFEMESGDSIVAPDRPQRDPSPISTRTTLRHGGQVAKLIAKVQRLGMGGVRVGGHVLDDVVATMNGSSCSSETDMVVSVDDFLSEHSAIVSLQKQKGKKSFLLLQRTETGSASTMDAFHNYAASLKEYDRSQREQQVQIWSVVDEQDIVGLCGDKVTIKEATSTKEQLSNQNKETLDYALQCKDEPLCSELLLRWHAWLMGDGLDEAAGSFRSSPMENATTDFCPPEQVLNLTVDLCGTLERDWLPQVVLGASQTRGVGMATFAAAALVGFLDIGPFEAGNEQLGRILVNWALRRTGLPFYITLFSNQEEKTCFWTAAQNATQNLYQLALECSLEHETSMGLQFLVALRPLVVFLLGRIAKSIQQFGELVVEKARMALEEADARVVKRARERAADSTCIICLDDRPNIATLCCGKPVHLNCLAEWLSCHTSCPQCRSDLPNLSSCREVASTSSRLPTFSSQVLHFRVDDDSVVEQLMNYVTNESANDSSSSSSSSSFFNQSSSSSSSSSAPSVLSYDELTYAVNNVTSDEEDLDDEEDNDDGDDAADDSSNDVSNAVSDDGPDVSSTVYDDEPDFDLDDGSISHRYIYEVEHDTIIQDSGVTESSTVGGDIVSPSSLSEYSIHQRFPDGVLCEDDEASDSATDTDQESHQNLLHPTTTFTSGGQVSFPRLSFLDPALLDNVQNGAHHNIPRDCDESTFADSSSTDDDGPYDSQDNLEENSIPAFARPLSMLTSSRRQPRRNSSDVMVSRNNINFSSYDNTQRPSASSYFVTGGHWTASATSITGRYDFYDFYDSDEYESETTTTLPPSSRNRGGGNDDESSPTRTITVTPVPAMMRVSQDPPAVCLEQECMHIASRYCSNKRCRSCCLKVGCTSCPRHGLRESDTGLSSQVDPR